MKKLFISLAFLTGMVFSSCNDSFLNKTPVTDLTEENAFNSYDNFKAFMWPCYEIFTNTTIRTSLANRAMDGQYQGDMDAGYFESKETGGFNKFAFQTVADVATGNGWNFKSFIRRVNIMLSHIDGSSMTEAEKKHWRAVGYFFHSFWYMELIDRFGDIPWVEQVLQEDSPEAYGPREDRKAVADRVLDRLKWAEENIGDFTSEDGENTINQDCVRAALSRFTLREGTWRKYHELGDYEKYFKECVRVSELLMTDYPELYKGTDKQPAAGYGEMWTTEDLSGVPGIILYKSYVANINPHSSCNTEKTSSHLTEMNQKTVDLYLMNNGKPIGNPTSDYQGKERDMYAVFRDRDPRLYHTVIPPYKVTEGKTKEGLTWSYTDNEADREYIDIMGENESCSNPGIGMKRLPAQNWTAKLVPEIPRLLPGAYVGCRSGYYVWKNTDNWETNSNQANTNTSDKPIFKIEEVLLNEAEAKFELGAFDQNVADKTINKLRQRAGVTKMEVAEINENFDPARGKYYPKGNDNGVLVDPVLWEIRRERIIELMGEGFGFYDIRRWRMAPWFLNRPATGLWISKEEATKGGFTLYNPETGVSDGTNGELKAGNLFLFNDPTKEGKGWLEKYYLYQVPTTEILLNPELEQNPGW